MSAPNPNKCYNSVSCILSVMLIVFIIGSIIWDLTITKPALRSSIEEIKTEVQIINQKLDSNNLEQQADTAKTDGYFMVNK